MPALGQTVSLLQGIQKCLWSRVSCFIWCFGQGSLTHPWHSIGVAAIITVCQSRKSCCCSIFLPLQAVKKMSTAHTTLRQEAERWSAGRGAGRAGQASGWAAVQAEGQDASVAQGTNASFPLLSSIMDPGLSLERSAHAAQVHLICTS